VADAAVADRPAIGRPATEVTAAATITANRMAPAIGVPPRNDAMTTMTSPATTSLHRSAYSRKRSASSTRDTTSPGGVRASRCCRVCPSSTDIRIRSEHADHHGRKRRSASANTNGSAAMLSTTAMVSSVGVTPFCRFCTR
jgi:hypothetical protein